MRKVKLVILVILVIALPAASALLLTLAAPSVTPWAWVRDLKAEDVSGEVWRYDGETPLSGNEMNYLVELITKLDESEFTENKTPATVPDYGVRLDGKTTVFINQTSTRPDALELSYNGKQWWIDDDELEMCIYKLTEGFEFAVNPELTLTAQGYIKEQIKKIESETRTLSGEPIVIREVTITKLEQAVSLEDELSKPVELWLLEFRLLPDCLAGDIVLTDDMRADNGWITEWTSDGQPYMLVYHTSVKPPYLYGYIYTDDIERAWGMKEAALDKLTDLGWLNYDV